MSVRKAHNSGRNHERNVLDYYQRTALPQLPPDVRPLLSEGCSNGRSVEIGHEKAQSVIDSITSSYAAEGQAGSNPMLNQGGGPMGGPGFPPPFGFPGRISRLHTFFRIFSSIWLLPSPKTPLQGAT